MKRRSEWFALAALAGALALPPAAQGSAQRTFVASYGLDANPCSVSAPCRSFTQAATQTNAGGEIIVLDSAGYGPVSITQSLSIIAPPGVYAGISVFSGNGVTISGASIRVVLRGLSINGQAGAAAYGIQINDSDQVHVENVVVSGMSLGGVAVFGATHLYLHETVLRGNAAHGLILAPAGLAIARVSIERLRIEGNLGDGIFIDNNVLVDIRDSVIVDNAAFGIDVWPDSGEVVSVSVEGTAVNRNGFGGINARGGGGGVVLVGSSIIKDNGGVGLNRTAPSIFAGTRQNSTIYNNFGGDVVGTTPVPGL